MLLDQFIDCGDADLEDWREVGLMLSELGATEQTRLANLRHSLRKRPSESSVCDSTNLARELENAYARMHRY